MKPYTHIYYALHGHSRGVLIVEDDHMGPMMRVSDEVRVNQAFQQEDFVLMFEGGGRDLSTGQHQSKSLFR